MIKEIVTHGSPAHLDEFGARIILRDHGEEKLHGVGTAIFRCLRPGDNVKELAQRKDVVLLGIGAEFINESNKHRIFDEHVVNGDQSKKDLCVAILTAQFVGIDQRIEWRKILKYVLHTDKNPSTATLGLAEDVIRFQRSGRSLSYVSRKVEESIYAFLAEQKQFAEAANEALDTALEEHDFAINGETLKIMVVESENPMASRAARFFGAAVVVAKDKLGHIQILTTNSLDLDMRDIIRVLRLREQWAKWSKGDKEVTDWKYLEGEGVVTEMPEWSFHGEANNILNGGYSRPDITPTRIPLNLIIDTIKLGLEKRRFEPSRQEKCIQGICTSAPRNPCPWYNLGLIRCRTTRAEMHRTKASKLAS